MGETLGFKKSITKEDIIEAKKRNASSSNSNYDRFEKALIRKEAEREKAKKTAEKKKVASNTSDEVLKLASNIRKERNNSEVV